MIEQRVVAFLGESGCGKSTLAAFLDAECDHGWERVVDDILPVTPTSAGLDALPHFPQLKLPVEAQASICHPERLPIAAIYVLPQPVSELGTVEIQSLTAREATLALVRHTVAARLFDSELLSRHLSCCSWAAARIPIRRLTYPHRYDVLPHLGDVVAADLRTLMSSDDPNR